MHARSIPSLLPALFLAVPLALATAGCQPAGEASVDVAVIGAPDDLAGSGSLPGGTPLTTAGNLVRTATQQGLVRLDETGAVVPGIAERWIVTADGTSYIFRIREMDLPRGRRVSAPTVRQALAAAIRAQNGTPLGRDLAKVRDVRAMTGRVIEIRLTSPMPGFLQLLAQPELGLAVAGYTTGPMRMVSGEPGTAVLTALPPEVRGLPAQPDWARDARPVRLAVASAAAATRAFADGRFAVLLGGTLANLPLANVGPLSRGTVRLDPAIGLFGIDIRRTDGFLASAANREALALALDRSALLKPFNIAGWTPTTRLVSPGLPDDAGQVAERWNGMEPAQLRAAAAARVARWARASGGAPTLTIALPPGPGWDTLFAGLREQYAEVGITLSRATAGTPAARRAHLALRDRIAQYAGPRWFLNQFHCSTGPAVCSADADMLVDMAVGAGDPVQQARYLAEAETVLTAANGYIPIGTPIRWSLVRSGVAGFAENPWAIHPLFPLSRAPI